MDLRRIPPDVVTVLGAAAGAAILLFALLQTLRLAYRPWVRSRRLASSRERGALGEIGAEALLRRSGFTIVGRQVGVTYSLGVDGARVSVDLRADYVVSGGGRRYVAEVKTGAFAPRIETAATRRQLLEYRVAFDAFGVTGALLVDAEADRVLVIEFPLPAGARGASSTGRAGWLLFGLAAGVVGATFLARAGW